MIDSLPVFIHPAIIFHIFSGNNLLPPFTVIQIPLYCFYNTIIKFCFRQPTKLIMYLCWVNSVA